MPVSPERTPLLSVKDLYVQFPSRGSDIRAVDGASIELAQGEILGLVGESGCGKSTLSMTIMQLVPKPGRIVSGEIHFLGKDLRALTQRELRQMRGQDMGLVVQDALAAMNPVTRVQEQVGEVIRDHEGGKWSVIRERVLQLLRSVNIHQPKVVLRKYAHQLSGGMQQRVIIAGALILSPKLLIADEPTTALDVTVQAQILELLRSIREETNTGILFVSHDLATIADICDRVAVMYAGRIVETGPVDEVFNSPIHPYTQALIGAIPSLDGQSSKRLKELGGELPSPDNWPSGCRFHPRCSLRLQLGEPEECVTIAPANSGVDAQHSASCHFIDQIEAMSLGSEAREVDTDGSSA